MTGQPCGLVTPIRVQARNAVNGEFRPANCAYQSKVSADDWTCPEAFDTGVCGFVPIAKGLRIGANSGAGVVMNTVDEHVTDCCRS